MGRLYLFALVFVPLSMPVFSQTVAVFTVGQPSMFAVDAGSDQMYSGSPITLGGIPTAVGGGGEYDYSWEPTSGLDDPSSANPVLEELPYALVFTVTVTDMGTGCVKADEVLVTLNTGSGMVDQFGTNLLIHPNPAATQVCLEADVEIKAITVQSLSGQQVLLAAYPTERTAVLDIVALSDGMYLLSIALADGRTITQKLCKASSEY